MTRDITQLTMVPDSKDLKDYQRGDIGQPLSPIGDSRWILCCPGCGNTTVSLRDRIIENDDGTVSSTQPLHCHGRNARQRYSIDHNKVGWL